MTGGEGRGGMSHHDVAAFWMLQRDDGRDLAHDAEFQSWLAKPGAREAWESAERIWGEFSAEPEDPLMTAMRQTALAVRKPRFHFSYQAMSAVAAALVLAVGGSLGWYHSHLAPPDQPDQVATMIATAPGETKQVVLADGSVLRLAGASRLRVAMSAGQRDAELLAGEAFLTVVHDAARPFVLRALDRRVTDLGTEFDVMATTSDVRVVLVSGSVQIAGSGEPVTLVPGQQFAATRGQDGSVSQVDPQVALAWRDGFLVFQDAKLSDAVDQMNRTLHQPIHLSGNIGDLRVSGRFRSGDGDTFVAALVAIHPLRPVHHPDGSITLKAR